MDEDLNVGDEVIKLLEENIGVNQQNLGLGNVFKIWHQNNTKQKIKQINCISWKLKISILQKILPTKWKDNPQNERIIYLKRALYPEYMRTSVTQH